MSQMVPLASCTLMELILHPRVSQSSWFFNICTFMLKWFLHWFITNFPLFLFVCFAVAQVLSLLCPMPYIP